MPRAPDAVSFAQIVACFVPGSRDPLAPIAQLAAETGAELVGLFIEDVELLRFAALPFAAEVGFPSAVRRALDAPTMERMLRAQALALKQALDLVLAPAAVPWSFRVARASPADAIWAALAETQTPALLIPPGSNVRAERIVARRSELSLESLRDLIAAARPALILPI